MPLGKLATCILLLGWTLSVYASEKGIPYPVPHYGEGEHRKLVARGEYLTKASDCLACHTDTKNNGIPFAGGLAFPSPFGTLFSPNITPDKETGIGNWTDEDFVRAMHNGVAPDGANYYPAFPYTSFNKMSLADVLAIKAYLFSIPPVKQKNRENQMLWPFNWRFLQHGWRTLFFYFDKGQYKEDPTRSEEWNRGAYLVQGPGHCGMCHTPTNFLFAPKPKYALRGNMTPDGYYAPDISADGLKNARVEEIIEVFTKDKRLNNAGKVGGPMAEVNHNSLIYMTDSDLRAIAVYLKTVESAPLPKESTGGPITADTGKKIYRAKCAICHDSGAADAPKLSDKMTWEKILGQGMETVFQHAIKGYNSMPAKGTCMSCSDEEIKATVEYMVEESRKAAVTAVPVVTKFRPTLADGKALYTATCSVCHADGKLGAPKVGDKAVWAPRIAQGMEVLFKHAIEGYHRMPLKGTCIDCSNSQIQAAVKYMVEQSKTSGDYSLW